MHKIPHTMETRAKISLKMLLVNDVRVMRKQAKATIGEFRPVITQSKIRECHCGNRYIKTRVGQVECHRCIRSKEREEEAKLYGANDAYKGRSKRNQSFA